MRTFAAAMLLFAMLSEVAIGQEGGQTDTEIRELVEKLSSPVFRTRTAAKTSLTKIGDRAIGPLRAALADAGLQQRLILEGMLKRLEANTFDRRLSDLVKVPSPQMAERFSQWGRFAEIVGEDKQAIDLFIRLVRAEPSLFAVADRDATELRAPLAERSAELHSKDSPGRFSFDSFAAVLLLASNNEVTLGGATSYNISKVLTGRFKTALQEDDGPRYLKLVGAWILRKNINTAAPLEFAIAHPLPEGLQLARKTLKGYLRKAAAKNAMSLIEKQGDVSDIALLESLFNPQHPEYNKISARGIIFKAQKTQPKMQYVCYYGDWALAVAIKMRGRHPFEFGLTSDKNNTPPNTFAVTEGTTGFRTEAAREAALKMYQVEFLTQKPKQQ